MSPRTSVRPTVRPLHPVSRHAGLCSFDLHGASARQLESIGQRALDDHEHSEAAGDDCIRVRHRPADPSHPSGRAACRDHRNALGPRPRPVATASRDPAVPTHARTNVRTLRGARRFRPRAGPWRSTEARCLPSPRGPHRSERRTAASSRASRRAPATAPRRTGMAVETAMLECDVELGVAAPSISARDPRAAAGSAFGHVESRACRRPNGKNFGESRASPSMIRGHSRRRTAPHDRGPGIDPQPSE